MQAPLTCQIHDNQQIISVCLKQGCQKNRILCFLCTQEHTDHFASLAQLDEVKGFANSLNDSMIQEYQENNNKIKSLNQLKEGIVKFLEKVNIEIEAFNKICDLKSVCQKQINNNEDLQQFIDVVLPFSLIEKNKLKLQTDQEEKAKQQQINQVKCLYEPLLIKLDELKAQFNLINSSNQRELVAKQLIFSEVHKHPEISIEDHTVAIKKTAGLAIVYADAEYDLNKDDFRFAVKILNKPSNVWVGIGTVKSHTYTIQNYGEIGHYHYMISTTKFIYHHSDYTINYLKRGFGFGQGDIINIVYNHKTKTLQFSKYKSESKITMDIVQTDLFVRPFVSLLTNDSAQIMEYQD